MGTSPPVAARHGLSLASARRPTPETMLCTPYPLYGFLRPASPIKSRHTHASFFSNPLTSSNNLPDNFCAARIVRSLHASHLLITHVRSEPGVGETPSLNCGRGAEFPRLLNLTLLPYSFMNAFPQAARPPSKPTPCILSAAPPHRYPTDCEQLRASLITTAASLPAGRDDSWLSKPSAP